MARPQGHDGALACLSLLVTLLLFLLPAATTAASYSSLCPTPAPAPDLPASHRSSTARRTVPVITTGHFSGGENLRFAPDQLYIPRSFSLYHRRPARATENPSLLHVFATVSLVGTHRSIHHGRPHSVSFDLEGYYYTAESSSELCMVGSGSYARDDGFGVVLLSDVVLRLHVPRPANLSHPLATGRLDGAEFGHVTLVAYADDDYKYGEAASCPAPPAPVPQVCHKWLSSCRRIKAMLRGSYTLELEYAGNVTSESPLRLRHQWMRFNQIHCAGNGVLRAYIAFDTRTNMSHARLYNYTMGLSDGLEVGDEALVAEGFWDEFRSQFCLRACRVVRAGASRADLAVRECDVGVSLWFPTVWSIRDRSVASGMIWNTSMTSSDGGGTGKTTTGVISVSKSARYRDDLSYIVYNYTRVEEAKKHYDLASPPLSRDRKGRFPGNYSFQDFAFSFYLKEKQGSASVYGYASPVTIGSAVVEGDRLMAFEGFYSNWTADTKENWLLNISYDLWYYANFSRQHRISAEGVYDTETGSLCMVGCQLISNNGSSSDCEVLVTAQFAPVDAEEARERVSGTISSLRKKGDPLFFEALDFAAEGMYAVQIEDSVSRMDMERVMLVVSMTFSCVFTGMQLRHVKKHPEALPATSVTMLIVLAVGYAVPLMLNLDLQTMFADNQESPEHRRWTFVQLTEAGLPELNELVLRISSMLAFVLQLRLLQLALASRQTPAVEETGGNKQAHEDASSSSTDAERSTLWICLPLYALGAVLVWIVHMSAFDMQNPWYRPRALVDHLAAYAGLVLDGFLLPQVVWNAFAGSNVRELSPWFYAGGSLVRAAPHAYDVFRRQNYVPSWAASYVYASPREDLFGVAWDVAVPCVAAVLAMLVFLQQRLGGAFLCGARGRRTGGYGMVSTLSS